MMTKMMVMMMMMMMMMIMMTMMKKQRQRLHEHGFISTRFHDFETVLKTFHFWQRFQIDPVSPTVSISVV